MTDTLANPDVVRPLQKRIDVTSESAVRRVRSRYRAENRFRAYGMGAICFAALFLVILLTDIVLKAIPAFTQVRLNLNLPVSAEYVSTDKVAAGDFDAIVRDGMRTMFPQVTTRADKKALSNILSSGAADYLRAEVVGNPALIGQSVSVPVILSSDADLYLKGITTERVSRSGEAAATVSGTSGTVTISTPSASFADELELLKKASADVSDLLDGDIETLSLNAKSIGADIKAAENRLSAARASNDAQSVAELEAKIGSFNASKAGIDQRLERDRAIAAALTKLRTETGNSGTLDSKMPSVLISINGGVVKATNVTPNSVEGNVLVPLISTETAAPGTWRTILIERPEDSRKIQDHEAAFLERLSETGATQQVVNFAFLTSGDSREPELAGILGSLAGSAFTMLVTLVLCLPIGVGAAIYLEEFAPKNRLTEIIEVNINNLAAVPSIVFGLLGLAMFLNFFGMPRSAPLVGGLVLALLVLPTIIIASRAALKAVPPSIREAALGIGASKQQAIFHHVLPLAMPGILTGTIIGMAHALGESAPLLMIGMIAFIVDVPARVTDAATVLPVQIFLWSDLPEIGFKAKTAAAIIVLLMFLFVMNGLAIWLRKRFERRW
jgi:phosphate transport system permease protein